MRAWCSLVVTGMLLLAGAATAHAGTVRISDNGQNFFLSYEAGSGERNDLTIAPAGSTATVHDTAGVTPGAGCSRPNPADATTAVCPYRQAQPGDNVTVKLGDLDDKAAVTGGGADLDGGPGNDVLQSAPSGGFVFPGPGNDEATGGTGEDHFFDDVGSDHVPFDNPAAGSDVYRGGGGNQDTIEYSRGTGVRVGLDAQRDDGGPGENDLVGSDVENVHGTRADDVLIGSGANNLLIAGGGSDQVAGGGGGDELYGGEFGDPPRGVLPDRDRVDGGQGNDSIHAGGGAALLIGGAGEDRLTGGPSGDDIRARDRDGDRVEGCGAGRDTARVDRLDFVGPQFSVVSNAARVSRRRSRDRCERIRRRGLPAPVFTDTDLSRLSVNPPEVGIGCSSDMPRRCRARLLVSIGRRRILNRSFSLSRGTQRYFGLRLPRAIRNRVRRHRVTGRALLRGRDARGHRVRQRHRLVFRF